MANLYAYSVNGTALWSASLASLSTPTTLDYLGSGNFVVTSNKSIDVIEVSAQTVTFIRQLFAYAAGTDGTGVALTHHRNDSVIDWTSNEFFLATISTSFDPITAYLNLCDTVGRQEVKQYNTFVDGTFYAGLMWDGLALWSCEELVDASQTYVRYDVNGGSAVSTLVTSTPLSKVNDITFDGQHHIFIDNDHVVFAEASTPSEAVVTWAHGLTNPKGIAFDGKDLFIVAD